MREGQSGLRQFAGWSTAPDCDPFHFYHLVKSRRTYGLDDTPIYEDRTKKGVPYDYAE
jgi:hypothetical protein